MSTLNSVSDTNATSVVEYDTLHGHYTTQLYQLLLHFLHFYTINFFAILHSIYHAISFIVMYLFLNPSLLRATNCNGSTCCCHCPFFFFSPSLCTNLHAIYTSYFHSYIYQQYHYPEMYERIAQKITLESAVWNSSTLTYKS